MLVAYAPCSAAIEFAPLRILALRGPANPSCLGLSAARLGDIDGDGRGDFALGAPNSGVYCETGSGNAAPAVFVYTGRTGDLLFKILPDPSIGLASQFGAAVANAGDLDGDGVSDIIVGAPGTTVNAVDGTGVVYVYSGATGTRLYRIEGLSGGHHGTSVAGVGDIDGDGRSDFAVSGSAIDSVGARRGSVYVYSGRTGSAVLNLFGTDTNEGFGSSIASLGDIDGDGWPDLLVGAPDAVCGTRVGAAYLFSGATGSLLYPRICGPGEESGFGTSVAMVPDRDADGHRDFLVGAPSVFSLAGGSVTLFSGASGTPIVSLNGASLERFGASLADAGDFDGDGLHEIAVGVPRGSPRNPMPIPFGGTANLYSGANDSLLTIVSGWFDYGHLGAAVAGVGDVNGDSRDDFLVGSPAVPACGVPGAAGVALVYGLVDIRLAGIVGGSSVDTHIGSGNPLCIRFEPVGSSYSNMEIEPPTMILRPSTGIPREIKAVSVDRMAGDSDGNGVPEVLACFTKDDLRWFVCSSQGSTTTALLEGDLASGARFRAPMTLSSGSVLALRSTVAPNPIRSDGFVTFATSQPGPVRVRLYNIRGQLVRTLMNESSVPAGFHDIPIGRTAAGGTLPSGVYVYRIDALEGTSTGRVVLLR